jgi:electron transfer flavoprotein beta subunit
VKILVAVKRVVDYKSKVRVKPDGSGVDTSAVKMSMNPFDEIALEEAVRLKEKGLAKEVIVVSIGDAGCQETLRQALALGADTAIHVNNDQWLEPLHIAKILRTIVSKEYVDLALLGKQAIDDDCNQVGQMLASLLFWPQATFASSVAITDGNVSVVREVDSGLETLSMSLPAVITVDLRLNKPRYASLPNIMKAKAKPIKKMTVDELGLQLKQHIEVLHVKPPVVREAGISVSNIKELMDILKQKDVI